MQNSLLFPSPDTTIVILFGASEWPYAPEFGSSMAFAHSARAVKNYFLHSTQGFELPEENLLDVFDSDLSADDLDREVSQFLHQRTTAMKSSGKAPRDLLVYFIGHGGFVGRDLDFYLAIRRTRMENPRISSISMVSLADTLAERARYLRRVIILDCCFAAAAFGAFQAEPAQIAIIKTFDAFEVKKKGEGFPRKGTALLCSSDQKTPSLLLPDGSATMFTKALVDALAAGKKSQDRLMSLRDIKDLVADILSDTPYKNAPKPVVHSPDQSEGDIADIPLFPNFAERNTETYTPLTPDVGMTVGNYSLIQFLGEGNFAKVYLGKQRYLETLAAIKVLKTSVSGTDAEQFHRETKVAAKLVHPHIIQILDFGIEGTTPYIVTTYASHGSLRRLHPRGSILSISTVIAYVRRIADALFYAHQCGMVHGDIKPDYIYLGDADKVLLGEFGITKFVNSTFLIDLTTNYAAPEVIMGSLSPASDQYSLGAIIYEWLCGVPALQGDLMQRLKGAPPPPLKTKVPSIPPLVEEVVMIALAKEPQNRFKSVRAFANALEHAALMK